MEFSAPSLLWATLTGGVLVLCATTLIEGLISRDKAAWHVLVGLLLSGSFAVVMSGLLEAVSPALQNSAALFCTKVAIGPLAGAFILLLLGKWLGTQRDRALHFSTQWGAVALLATALGLGGLAQAGTARPDDLLLAAAMADGAGVVIGAHACVRAAVLGDRLAWVMALSCACLAVAVAGLHGIALSPTLIAAPVQLLTALCAGGFCLISSWLALLRNLQHRAHHHAKAHRDPLTRLPTRNALFKRIDDAVSRSAWLRRECAVIAVSVSNLRGLNVEAGYDIDHDIASQLAARLVRLAGIHNLVGLYDPACFVVVVPALDQSDSLRQFGLRLAKELRRPVNIRSYRGDDLQYKAELGIGIVLMSQRVMDSFMVLEQAESFAQAARRFASRVAVGEVTKDRPAPVETYDFPRRTAPRTTGLADNAGWWSSIPRIFGIHRNQVPH